jgi:pSer/pThr/pTyr-binding forkhead associated (FHA) protein
MTQLPGGTNLAGPALNQEFMYGGQQGGQFGVPAQQAPQAPPPDPYAQPAGPVSRATLQGAAGVFTVVPGVEIKAGRDGAQCGILLSEPRVSGVHATMKIENGQLLVRDEHSNNGTLVNGTRLNPGVWMPVQNGSLVRFGPVEFSTRLE